MKLKSRAHDWKRYFPDLRLKLNLLLLRDSSSPKEATVQYVYTQRDIMPRLLVDEVWHYRLYYTCSAGCNFCRTKGLQLRVNALFCLFAPFVIQYWCTSSAAQTLLHSFLLMPVKIIANSRNTTNTHPKPGLFFFFYFHWNPTASPPGHRCSRMWFVLTVQTMTTAIV